jgi:hypothetical protein
MVMGIYYIVAGTALAGGGLGCGGEGGVSEQKSGIGTGAERDGSHDQSTAKTTAGIRRRGTLLAEGNSITLRSYQFWIFDFGLLGGTDGYGD